MKWKMTNGSENPPLAPNSNLNLTNAGRVLSALIYYTMKKRKLENEQHGTLNSSRNGYAAHQAKKVRSTLTRKELSAIQTQLAILSDRDGDRPIHIAVANENLKLVQTLCLLMIKNSISLDITNYLRQTPLHLAVMLGNIELIKLLLNFGASPLLSDRNGNSVLHLAVKSNNRSKEVLHVLLFNTQVRSILNSMDYEGYSPLHYAVFKNNSDAVQVLHDYGADMDKIDGKSGRTALIHAVLEQNIEMVELLLKCGACPRKIDYSGRSAFDMAMQVTNIHVVKLLEKWIPQNEISPVKEQMQTFLQHVPKVTKEIKNQN